MVVGRLMGLLAHLRRRVRARRSSRWIDDELFPEHGSESEALVDS